MVKLVPFLLALVLIQLTVLPATALLSIPGWDFFCDELSGNYSGNGAYEENINYLVVDMITNTTGFYNSSAGQAPNVVYLTSFCFGDLSIFDCRQCQTGHNFVVAYHLCPNYKEATFWSDSCMMRYSPNPTHGVISNRAFTSFWGDDAINSSDVVHVKKYAEAVQHLLESLPNKTSVGGSSLKFATGQAAYNSSLSIYAAAQCTPDVTQKDCLQCLRFALKILKQVKGINQRNWRIYFQSCTLKYDQKKFYLLSNGAPNSTTPQDQQMLEKGGTIGKKKIIVAAVAGSACVSLFVVASIILIKQRAKLYLNMRANIKSLWDDDTSIESLQFQFSIVRAATGNFSEANKLGEGGFGVVYKGRLPSNGQEIAVKRLSGKSKQGEEEFKNEIKLLSKLQHKNVVRLIGFCCQNKERLLIYEFVPNASLDHFLFGEHTHLDWKTRAKIVSGIARGIRYLQEDSRLRIIHCDLKAGNVLLDVDMCPKIADFGLGKLFDSDQTHANTTHRAGTFGYMAPEYAIRGVVSPKLDVYSFGVVLLEIVCGRRCSKPFSGESSDCLISFVWKKWREGSPLDIVDSGILDRSESEILRFIHVALLCIQDRMADRPTMSEVVHMMSNEALILPTPSQPAYTMESNLPLNTQEYTGQESITEVEGR